MNSPEHPIKVFVYPCQPHERWHEDTMQGLKAYKGAVSVVENAEEADLIICHSLSQLQRHNPCPQGKTIALLTFGLKLTWTPPKHVLHLSLINVDHDLVSIIKKTHKRKARS